MFQTDYGVGVYIFFTKLEPGKDKLLQDCMLHEILGISSLDDFFNIYCELQRKEDVLQQKIYTQITPNIR